MCGIVESLPEFPQALKYLRIESCRNVRQVPGSFGELRALRHLEIRRCRSLVLPHTLENLEHLEIKECADLGNLGDIIGKLKALKRLEVITCNNSNVPLRNSGQLEALEYLSISGFEEYEQFWEAHRDGLGKLRFLKYLRLFYTRGFKALLKNILGDFRAPEVLRLEGCLGLETLPKTLGQLQALKTLTITSRDLQTLPNSLGQLRALQYLHIEARPFKGSSRFGWEPPSVGVFVVNGDGKMKTLPDAVGKLQALKHLSLHKFSHVKSLPHSLKHLVISGNGNFLTDNLGQLQALEELKIEQYSRFRSLPDTVPKLQAILSERSWSPTQENTRVFTEEHSRSSGRAIDEVDYRSATSRRQG